MAEANNIWLVEPNTLKLISPFQLIPGKEIKLAEPFTIDLKFCIVFEDFDQDIRRENDILIVSHQALGDNQPIRQVHFFQKEIREGTPLQNFTSGTIYATEDYSGEKLNLIFEVIEVDNDQEELEKMVAPINDLLSFVGGIFPLLSFYTSLTNVAVNFFEKVYKSFDSDEQVFSVPFTFFPHDQIQLAEAPLQKGDYIVFAKPIDAEGIQLGNNGQINVFPNNQKIDYLRINIKSGMSVSPKFIIGQKLETILSQLRFGKGGTEQGETVSFLLETMTTYKKFRDLERYQELLRKTSRTIEEENRFQQLANNSELKPYLPSK